MEVIYINEEVKPCYEKDAVMKIDGSGGHILTGVTGDFVGCFYNPWNENSFGNLKTAEKGGLRLFQFKSVSAKVFDLYLHYLKTQQETFLRQAEREKNG